MHRLKLTSTLFQASDGRVHFYILTCFLPIFLLKKVLSSITEFLQIGNIYE